jgi:hypothetical protein
MNNFIVGQVTPDMLTHMRYGTYIFFGLITLGGAFFVWKFVPETKGLSLEEMDVLFGSVGFAARDREIMDEVNREVGLTDLAGHTDMTNHDIQEKGKALVTKEEEAGLSG